MVVTPAEVAADHAGLLFGRGRVQRPELVQADDDRGVTGTGPPLGRRRSQTARAPGSSWSRRSGRSRSSALCTLNGPALLAQQQAQSLVADNRRPPLGDLPLVDHPLATRCSASFGPLQRRNRQPVVGGPTPGDLGDLGALVGAEGRRAAAPVGRVERVNPSASKLWITSRTR